MSRISDLFNTSFGDYGFLWDGNKLTLTRTASEPETEAEGLGVKERLLTILNKNLDCGKHNGAVVSNIEIVEFLIANGVTFTDTEVTE